MRSSVITVSRLLLAGLLGWGPALVAGTVANEAAAASPTARYRVRFDGTWSAATHPISFPPNPHFSPLIGGTHDASVGFWSVGALASTGIKDMAERGLTTPLDNEIGSAITAGTAAGLITGSGINLSPGNVSATFDIPQSHPLVTLVSMIAPSPDWFVGVSGLSLLRNGEWVTQQVVPLFAYDAGTDSGTNYTSPNQITSPPQPIALSTAPPFTNGAPLGIFTFTRIEDPSTTVVPAASHAVVAGMAAALLLLGAWALRRRAARGA